MLRVDLKLKLDWTASNAFNEMKRSLIDNVLKLELRVHIFLSFIYGPFYYTGLWNVNIEENHYYESFASFWIAVLPANSEDKEDRPISLDSRGCEERPRIDKVNKNLQT